MTTAYALLNGTLIDAGKALVSAQDRGFRLGDGVFETVRVYHKTPYRLTQHLARLAGGLKALGIPADISQLPALCRNLLDKNKVEDGLLRILISRGAGSQGYLPLAQPTPSVFIETQPLPPAGQGAVDLWLSTYEKISPRALPVQFKLCNGLNSTLARMEAQQQDCFEALQLNAAGEICEGSSSNILWLQNGVLHTPALSCGVLAGITREALLKLSPYPVREGAYPLAALADAEVVVLTNSVWEVLPVRALRPHSYNWHSEALAATLLARLREDIARECLPA